MRKVLGVVHFTMKYIDVCTTMVKGKWGNV